jgi:hypothetical protein
VLRRNMATKTETIQKIEDACRRVLKQSDFAGGVVTALTLVIGKLTGLRDQVAGAGEIDPNTYSAIYDELYECGRIVGSIYDGLPMVPAEDVATLVSEGDTMEKSADELVTMATEELEKAAAEKGLAAGPGVALVKSAVAVWKAAGETDVEGAKVRVVRAEALPKLAKACGDKRRQAKADAERAAAKAAEPAEPPAPAPVDPVAKLDTIAKAAEPAPVPAPVEKSVWPLDLNAGRRGKR